MTEIRCAARNEHGERCQRRTNHPGLHSPWRGSPWAEPAEHCRGCLAASPRGDVLTDKIAWLVERTIDGRPHWLRWHDYDERVWVPDANQADHYPSRIPAARDARHLTKMGEPCEATEHIFIDRLAPAPTR